VGTSMRKLQMAVAGSLFLGLGLSTMRADLLTVDPGTGTTTTFTTTGNNGFGNPGPVVLNGFSVTGNPQATYGNAGYGLAGNGCWSCSPLFSWVATNNGTGSITFDLGGLFGFVGGFMNYAPGTGTDARITALAADDSTVISSFDLVTAAPINTPGGNNAGAFRGISSTTNDIRFLQLSGDFILTHTIETGTVAATPEPSSWLLLLTIVAGAEVIRRRRTLLSR